MKGLGFKARRNEGARCKVNKHARVQTKEQAERSRLGFKARRKVAERYSREVQTKEQAVWLFLF